MIPLEKLRALERAYVHKSCPDGVASALILQDALPFLEVHFVKYDTEEHKSIEPLPNTIFCDFSPWLPKVKEDSDPADKEIRDALINEWNTAGVIVLDHHSRDIVEPYTYGVFGENDKLECGAMLAYKYVWQQVLPQDQVAVQLRAAQVSELARLAAIRDTWKKDDPDFEKACRQASVCMFYRFEQLSILGVIGNHGELLATRLFERQIELAETCIKEAFSFTTERGARVLMFQGVSATSDAAEILGDKTDLVVGFHYRFDGDSLKLQFSTRSHTGYDCQALAKAHSGGGHVAAAGFTVVGLPMSPYDVFEDLLEDWEGA